MPPAKSAPGHGAHPLLPGAFWIAIAIFLTALEIHFISVKLISSGFAASLEASQGVVDGLPHWRIYQSRVLGPYLVHGIEYLLGLPAPLAYLAFIASCLLVTKLIVINFGLRQTTGLTTTLLMLVAGSLLFAMLVDKSWLYPWDLIGLVLFTLFVVMVLMGIRWPWFVPLAAVAFLNRESGIFICVWLFAQGLLGYGPGAGRRPPNIWMMAAAGITALAGLAETEWLRARLLVRELGPELDLARGLVTPGQTTWFHWKLEENLAGLLSGLTSPSVGMAAIFYVLPLAGIAIAGAIGVRRYPAYTALCLAYGMNLIFIFLFGIVAESRVMIEVIPFFAIFLPYVAAGGPRHT